MKLDKKQAIHERDDAGKLIPIEVPLELLSQKEGEEPITISATPLSRGELKKMAKGLKKSQETSEDQDGEIIELHCIDPKYTEEEIKDMKPEYVAAIATAIISISLNVDQSELKKAGKIAVQKYAEKLDGNLTKK